MDNLQIDKYLDAYIICYQLREMGIIDDDEILTVLKEQLSLGNVAAIKILSNYYENADYIKTYIKKNVTEKDLNKFEEIIDNKFLDYADEKKPSQMGDE